MEEMTKQEQDAAAMFPAGTKVRFWDCFGKKRRWAFVTGHYENGNLHVMYTGAWGHVQSTCIGQSDVIETIWKREA